MLLTGSREWWLGGKGGWCPGRGSEPGPGKDALSLTSPSPGMQVLWREKAGTGGSPEAGGVVNQSLRLASLQLKGPLWPGLLSTC